MAAEAVGEGLLVGGLDPVVELIGEPVDQLVGQAVHVHAGQQPGRQDRAHPTGVGQIAADGLLQPRVLHLDRHRPTVEQLGSVHLSDRGGGHRHRVPTTEQGARIGAQLVAHHP